MDHNGTDGVLLKSVRRMTAYIEISKQWIEALFHQNLGTKKINAVAQTSNAKNCFFTF